MSLLAIFNLTEYAPCLLDVTSGLPILNVRFYLFQKNILLGVSLFQTPFIVLEFIQKFKKALLEAGKRSFKTDLVL